MVRRGVRELGGDGVYSIDFSSESCSYVGEFCLLHEEYGGDLQQLRRHVLEDAVVIRLKRHSSK